MSDNFAEQQTLFVPGIAQKHHSKSEYGIWALQPWNMIQIFSLCPTDSEEARKMSSWEYPTTGWSASTCQQVCRWPPGGSPTLNNGMSTGRLNRWIKCFKLPCNLCGWCEYDLWVCYCFCRWPSSLTRACRLRSPARAATAKWFTNISEATFSFRRAQKTKMKL